MGGGGRYGDRRNPLTLIYNWNGRENECGAVRLRPPIWCAAAEKREQPSVPESVLTFSRGKIGNLDKKAQDYTVSLVPQTYRVFIYRARYICAICACVNRRWKKKKNSKNKRYSNILFSVPQPILIALRGDSFA